jgi:hypothetical protein
MAVPAAGWVVSMHPEITPSSNFYQTRDTTHDLADRGSGGRYGFASESWSEQERPDKGVGSVSSIFASIANGKQQGHAGLQKKPQAERSVQPFHNI